MKVALSLVTLAASVWVLSPALAAYVDKPDALNSTEPAAPAAPAAPAEADAPADKPASPESAGGHGCPATPFTVQRISDDETAAYRLPQTVRPEHYDVEIITHLGEEGDEPANFWFQGRVWIRLKANKATSEIRLHSVGLELNPNSTALQTDVEEGSADKPVVIEVVSQEQNATLEQLTLKLASPLQEGRPYLLSMAFKARLNQDLAGFYRSSYRDDESNSTRWLAVTQFESTDARRAFPCFDEPAFKATFTLSLGHHKRLRALSNMPAVFSRELPGQTDFLLTLFNKTVPMSTYLLAWLVSDFVELPAEKQAEEPQVSVWARRSAINQASYPVKISPKVLKFFEYYFDEKYPLPKQDMVAIPDFSAGAMENWGLITYRESQLLVDAKSTSKSAQNSAASTVVHELAHQWFGNLVTMKWWSDLWLNEGFATYMATLGVDHIEPEWEELKDTAADDFLVVTAIDSLQSSHPVIVPIKDPRLIAQIFDTITYRKGSSLLRMMHAYLGEKVFRTGVADYIHKHRYGNAEQDDLWESLTQKAHEEGSLPMCLTVKQIMDTWTVQTGYPLLTVTRDYDDSEGSATVTQNRYFADPTLKDDKSCWYVPITYTTQKNTNFTDTATKKWMTCDGQEVRVTALGSKDQWVIFNVGLKGVYRVQYDERNWNLLADALASPNYGGITELSRVQLLSDAFELTRSGRLDYKIGLNLAKYLRNERAYLPWRAGMDALSRLERVSRRSEYYDIVRAYLRYIVAPAASELHPLSEPPANLIAAQRHALLASWACRLELPNCQKDASLLLQRWKADAEPLERTTGLFNVSADAEINPVPVDVRRLVYCNAIKKSGYTEWEFLWRRFLFANVASERNVLLSALACSSETWVLYRYLDRSLSNSSGIRLQDSLSVFSSVVRTDVGFYVASKFLFSRLREIHKYYGPNTSKLGRYISEYASNVSGEEEYQELLAFVSKHEELLKDSDQTVRQAIESAKNNVLWRKTYLQDVGKLMKDILEDAGEVI